MKTFTLKQTFLAFAIISAVSLKANLNNGPLFTENKGQVHDQYFKNRPDVLFSGNNKGLVFHLKNNGLSYQLNKVDSWQENSKRGIKSPKQISIYRIDIDWLNSNLNSIVTKGTAMNGYDNFYLANCPDGIEHVLSYESLVYNNIYNNIDLKWYSKNGELEYDFIVKPGADYKQIKMEVKGAVLKKKNSGDILISTPFGDIAESAPKVYQEGKLLNSKWIIKNNVLSFDIHGHDPNKIMIIDPVSRIWGTYYGGTGSDVVYGTKVDASGNVLIVGSSMGSSGTSIATVGSYQTANAGGFDAYLAKFNASGIRQWATYYGGTAADQAFSCATDVASNIYITGDTYSGTGISTAGSHQVTIGGAAASDAFLAKFTFSGTRVWATYYGGTGNDGANSCVSDASGNVYVSGYTSSTTGTVIATASSHQPAFGGGTEDAFLVKFNLSGTRQWGTYYGGTQAEQGLGCALDGSGNVLMSGQTLSSGGIATAGSHQTTIGGSTDAYLVKFNSSGTRQWGTYYGGSAIDIGNSCSVDGSGNVYITGEAQTTTGTSIATVGSHQATFGGGTNDGFLAKFNSTGVRQWGTYYGGTGGEYGMSCVSTTAGDVYIAGYTGTASGTVIATAGSHQTANGGGVDLYYAKFNTLGVRQWGTFYGGSGNDYGYGCDVDGTGNCYLGGLAASTTSISTVGSHQSALGGGTDGLLVKFVDCNATLTTNATSPICSGQTATLTASGSGITSYSWSTGATTGTINTTPTITTNYTITANTSTVGCSLSSVLTVSVNSNPTVTIVGTNTICSGNSTTLTASGANTYSWNTSATTSSIVISPALTTTYNVIGTNTITGCSGVDTRTVTVNTTPSVTLTSGTASICSGSIVGLTASGATTYSWNTGATSSSISVSPIITTNYTVTGTTTGCSDTKTISINVTTTPTVNLSASSGTICSGNTSTITANGASTYSWNTGATTAAINVTPTVTTTYTVIGNNGSCSNTKTITIVNNTPNLNVSATSTAICSGGSSTLTASGATTYSWNTGATTPAINVSPTGNTTYTITGTTGACSTTGVITVNVSTAINMNIASSNSVSCSGAAVILTASGASTYTWSTGSNSTTISVTPSVSTTYTVNGTSGTCNGSTVVTIGISTNPTVNSVTSSSVICTSPSQQSATITASGATTYSWNTGATSAVITVSPGITTTYTVTGYNSQGCSNTSVITQSVATCSGLNESEFFNEVIIFPNPSNGEINIKGIGNLDMILINSIGQVVMELRLDADNDHAISLTDLNDGIYYLRSVNGKGSKKIVVTR